MLGMTDILDLLRLKLSKNWLPFIGKNMVIELLYSRVAQGVLL